jgi:hypothetical protein
VAWQRRQPYAFGVGRGLEPTVGGRRPMLRTTSRRSGLSVAAMPDVPVSSIDATGTSLDASCAVAAPRTSGAVSGMRASPAVAGIECTPAVSPTGSSNAARAGGWSSRTATRIMSPIMSAAVPHLDGVPAPFRAGPRPAATAQPDRVGRVPRQIDTLAHHELLEDVHALALDGLLADEQRGELIVVAGEGFTIFCSRGVSECCDGRGRTQDRCRSRSCSSAPLRDARRAIL